MGQINLKLSREDVAKLVEEGPIVVELGEGVIDQDPAIRLEYVDQDHSDIRYHEND